LNKNIVSYLSLKADTFREFLFPKILKIKRTDEKLII